MKVIGILRNHFSARPSEYFAAMNELTVLFNKALLEACEAELRPGMQWGRRAMEQFEFGKARAVEAARAILFEE
jgi:hypothetical protein